MSPPRGAVGALAALLVLSCLSSGARALGLEVSANMTDSCYTTPSAATCADFKRTNAEWEDDLGKLCKAMPFMVGCSMSAQCKSGEAKADSPYCHPSSLVADICGPDDMGGMKGCEAWKALCLPADSKVAQCKEPGAAPNVPTTYQTKKDIDGVCTTHSMDGCQDCSVAGTTFSKCPEVFNIYSKLCVSMPDMETCANWKTYCANADAAAAFPKFCTQDAADGSSTSLPPMKMWFHQGTREMFMFKEWVPNNVGQYIGLCIAMCALAVGTQFLKAVRLRVEMRWAANARQKQCLCPHPADADAADLEAGPGSSKPIKSSDSDSAVVVGNGPSHPCCGAKAEDGSNGDCSNEVPVPTTTRPKYWHRGAAPTGDAAFVVGGYQLITRDQAIKNFWRGVFTFVVIFLDYALMLVVMTFNVGIILAVCGGFAIGALLFGHAGEPGTLQKRGTAKRPVLTAAQTMAPGPLSANAVAPEAEELETVFVEGAGCCSGGGSGYGGGGHGGGQL